MQREYIDAIQRLVAALEAMTAIHGISQNHAISHNLPQSWVEATDLARSAIGMGSTLLRQYDDELSMLTFDDLDHLIDGDGFIVAEGEIHCCRATESQGVTP